MGIVGFVCLFGIKYLWINAHRQMGDFFIRFANFTITLVYSVVWNQSNMSIPSCGCRIIFNIKREYRPNIYIGAIPHSINKISIVSRGKHRHGVVNMEQVQGEP